MKNDEKGLTLVELLATLTLISLVTGIIWTTISIASQFNIGETTSLKLQQEANYIITELQKAHRTCSEYKLTIKEDEISIKECKLIDKDEIINKIISSNYKYIAIINEPTIDLPPSKMIKNVHFIEYIDIPQKPKKNDINLMYFTVQDTNNDKRFVNIPTTISRYKIK